MQLHFLQFVIDTDYSGDGFENVMRGELFDMAFLLQGAITPRFEVFQMWELNLSHVFEGFKADVYAVLAGEETKFACSQAELVANLEQHLSRQKPEYLAEVVANVVSGLRRFPPGRTQFMLCPR